MLDRVDEVERVVRPAVGCEVFGGVLVVIGAGIVAKIGVDRHVAVGGDEWRFPVRIGARRVFRNGDVTVIHDHHREWAGASGHVHLPRNVEIAAAVGDCVLGIQCRSGDRAHDPEIVAPARHRLECVH